MLLFLCFLWQKDRNNIGLKRAAGVTSEVFVCGLNSKTGRINYPTLYIHLFKNWEDILPKRQTCSVLFD